MKLKETCCGRRFKSAQVHQKHGSERRLTSDPTYKGEHGERSIVVVTIVCAHAVVGCF